MAPTRPFTIHNVRLGLATNSSSSHSIVLVPEAVRTHPRHADEPLTDRGAQKGRWPTHYQFATPAGKRDFLATCIAETLEKMEAPREIAGAIATAWAQGTPIDDPEAGAILTLPRRWDGRTLHPAFVADLRAVLDQPGVVVYGGRDDMEPDDCVADGTPLDIPCGESGPWVGRREPNGTWVLFNRTNGARLIVTFGEGPSGLGALGSVAQPLLVDVKLTDRCPFACPACYQDSTSRGASADPAFVAEVVRVLAERQVFEVAIGGGEPTLDPQFLPTLRAFRAAGVVPNFTTRSLAWLRDGKQRDAILEVAGAFAVSVSTVEDIEALSGLLRRDEEWDMSARERAAVQIVMGLQSLDETEALMRAASEARVRVTLLGYKRVGRGALVTPEPYEAWVPMFQRLVQDAYVTLAIDTTLAAESRAALLAAGVPDWSYQVEEGAVSMYIDAVRQMIAPSSFVPPGSMSPTTTDSLGADVDRWFPTFQANARASGITRGLRTSVGLRE